MDGIKSPSVTWRDIAYPFSRVIHIPKNSIWLDTHSFQHAFNQYLQCFTQSLSCTRGAVLTHKRLCKSPLLSNVTTSAMFGPQNLFCFLCEHHADTQVAIADDLGALPLCPVSFFPAKRISRECRLCRWSRKLIYPTVWSYNSLLIAWQRCKKQHGRAQRGEIIS